MNINIPSFSFAVYFFKESLMPSLSAQQKKIIIIASLALACLTACYMINRSCFRTKIKNGEGRNSYLFGLIVQEGTFKNGKLNGQGKTIWNIPFLARLEEEGEFEDDKLNGQGKITTGGIEQEGEFKNSELNGQGKITDSDGTVTEGEFKNNELNGQGKITKPDGSTEEGEFKNFDLNGQGKKTYPDGKVEEGLFEKGVLIQAKI